MTAYFSFFFQYIPAGVFWSYMDILTRFSRIMETFIEVELLPYIHETAASDIAEAVIYSLTAGGKRIRPFLLILSAGMREEESMLQGKYSNSQKRILSAASALEMIHTYSLIHDDLPAMDDDDMRRGKPSCHAKFGEWRGILAGDALNTLAFEILLHAVKRNECEILYDLIFLLSRAAGMGGMICGQALDLAAEKEPQKASGQPERKSGLLEKIHLNKTAAMIRASCEMGAVLSGSDRNAYRDYGEKLGLLFQIADDILDITGSSEELGKTAGKDAVSGKLTYPSLFGLEKSREMALGLVDELQRASENLLPGKNAEADYRKIFFELPAFVYSRNH